MKTLLMGAALLIVSACGRPDASAAAIESAETLVANPDRLKDLRAQCKADHARLGDAQCNAVAEATRRRFLGSMTPSERAAAPSRASAEPSSAPVP